MLVITYAVFVSTTIMHLPCGTLVSSTVIIDGHVSSNTILHYNPYNAGLSLTQCTVYTVHSLLYPVTMAIYHVILYIVIFTWV